MFFYLSLYYIFVHDNTFHRMVMKNNNLYKTLYLKVVFEDDHDAFKRLFFEFYPSLCLYARRYVSCPVVCEDIVQEVFYNIWKNRKIVNIHTSFRNFLITSVKNSCMDHLRKEYSHNRYTENHTPSTTTMSPIDIYTTNELQEMLKRSLDKLPLNIQSAFNMSRTQNMTYKEIATKMKVSPKTVESYISQALSILRKELKDYLPIILLISNF